MDRSKSWVGTPTHLLRWDCVRAQTQDWQPGRFAEFGAGQGDFTERFLVRGFEGACYDIGEQTRARLRERLADYGERIVVLDTQGGFEFRAYDYLFAFEVLEHIEDDRAALLEWMRCLRPEGRVIVTVPAHMRKFGEEDRFVGHVRRYEREQLQELLASVGLQEIHISSYGFPLANATRRIRKRWMHPEKEAVGCSALERSVASGTRRSRAVMMLEPFIKPWWVQPFCALQRLFFASDLGDGLVATARRERK